MKGRSQAAGVAFQEIKEYVWLGISMGLDLA